VIGGQSSSAVLSKRIHLTVRSSGEMAVDPKHSHSLGSLLRGNCHLAAVERQAGAFGSLTSSGRWWDRCAN
jgi:hypothetical protein